jgi:hypothetical protein
MFTVPFAENLAENMTYCPFCESEFHSVQHLRSFDVASLRALLAEHGFDVSFCDNVNLWTFQRPFPRRGQGVRGVLTNLADRSAVLLDRVDQRPFQRSAVFTRLATPGPHLCALASPRR